MCLIIFAPNVARARLRKAMLERAFYRNHDGAGIAYVKDGNVKVVKTSSVSFDDFYQRVYQPARSDCPHGPMLIHFRRKSHGDVSHVNVQPVVVYRGRLAMAHNGSIHELGGHPAGLSDSVYLGHMIRKSGFNYPFRQADRDWVQRMVGQQYNKLVFLDNRGHHTIINETLGEWIGGAWHSDAGDIYRDESAWSPKKGKKSRFGGYHQTEIIGHNGGVWPEYAHEDTHGPIEDEANDDDVDWDDLDDDGWRGKREKAIARAAKASALKKPLSNGIKITASNLSAFRKHHVAVFDREVRTLTKPITEVIVLPPDDPTASPLDTGDEAAMRRTSIVTE